MYGSWVAAEDSEKSGTFLYTVGINLDDTTELDEISSHPLDHYQLLVNDEEGLEPFIDGLSSLIHSSKFDMIHLYMFAKFYLIYINIRNVVIHFIGGRFQKTIHMLCSRL